MPHTPLVEARVAQLEAISTRRNELLRQMYQMMRQKQNVGNVLTTHDFDGNEGEEEDFHVFMQKFDLRKHGETASVTNHVKDIFEFLRIPSPVPSGISEEGSEQVQTSSTGWPRTSALATSPPNRHLLCLQNMQNDPRQENRRLLQDTFSDGQGPSMQHSPLNSYLSDEETDEDRDELDLIGSPPIPQEVRRSRSKNLPASVSRLSTPIETPLNLSSRGYNNSGLPPGPEAFGMSDNDNDSGHEGQQRDRESVLPPFMVESSTIVRPPLHCPELSESRVTKVDEIIQVYRDSPSMGLVSEDGKLHEASHAEPSALPTLDETVPTDQAAPAPPQVVEVRDSKDCVSPEDQMLNALSQPHETSSRGSANQNYPNLSSSQNPQYHRSTASSGAFVSPFLPHITKSIIIPAPREPFISLDDYDVDAGLQGTLESKPLSPPPVSKHQYKAQYSLPPLQFVPAQFNRKRSTKQRKKERSEGRKDKEDPLPLGLNRWSATLTVNPVWKKVAKSTKCLSTREWAVAMSELRLLRTMERIEALKIAGKWSFRQPKKQRGVGGLMKTHWDYLLDEMKWLRIDFREERRWKLALAYNLSTAVLEWHSLDSWEERIDQGVCIKWKPSSYSEVPYQENLSSEDMDISLDIDAQEQPKRSLLGVNYSSDYEDMAGDDEALHTIIDTLEPATTIRDALEAADVLADESKIEVEAPGTDITPKREDIDDTSALFIETQPTDVEIQVLEKQSTTSARSLLPESAETKSSLFGLKPTSKNPVLGSKSSSHSISGDNEQGGSNLKQPKIVEYAPRREQLAYALADKLFLDLHDLDLSSKDTALTDDIQNIGLATLFPELQPLDMLDVAPFITDVKKKSTKSLDRDDPNKRIEETTSTRLYPTGRFMFTKPTLLGPLHPAKHWKDGHWLPIEENPTAPDSDGAKISEESGSELFDIRFSNPPPALPPQPKDAKKRGTDHSWNFNDDMLLKSLIDRYPGNWALIAECFNGSRLTTPTDRRSPSDCLERWKEKWGVELRQKPLESAQATPEESQTPPTSQMTTRGVKRLASASVSSQYPPSVASGSEPKKRRRHLLLQESIRKTAKKRHEQTQKMLANQRKQIGIHETHNQYAKMPKLTPAELSRMKAEKDARDLQDLQQARRRQEELSRSLLRDQPQRVGGIPVGQAQLMQQQQQSQGQQGQHLPLQQQAQQLQQHQVHLIQQAQVQAQVQAQAQAQTNTGQRVVSAITAVPNTRPGTVNISRISTPTVVAGGTTTRLSQQMLQIQQRAAVAHAQQALNGVANVNSAGALVTGAHIASPFTSRDATSSPAHVSSPQVVVNTANVISSSPRPPHEQLLHQPGLVAAPQMSSNHTTTRPAGNHFYLPNLNGTFTNEQMQNALRIQMLQHHLIQQQQAQQQQGQSQASNPGTLNGF